ncbi:hypothetical protein COHA_002002 [Chlorella ohadii]|uniref:MYND-type domain-containing protein n=1 Tax=Chlorella ohadii TaxID=2649997 RepID=A0AAD5DXW4_9CHLO|nr:hypothetical protein COHA_002002 [Chlorella ohadii]
MSSDLLELLQRLERGFSAPCASRADAEALFADAVAFRREARRHALAEPAGIPSALAALLQRLGALNRALPTALELNGAAETQFNAACLAIEVCAQLASRLPLQHNDMFRLSSAVAVVFGTGPALLQRRTSAAAGAPTYLEQLFLACARQLAAASAALRQAVNMRLQPEATAAFVRTVGRAEAVLPWLAAVSQALLAVPSELQGARLQQLLGGSGDAAQGWHARVHTEYAELARSFLAGLTQTYSAALQQLPATQQAVLSVLLDRCLPVLAAGSSPDTLANEMHSAYGLAVCLGYALESPCLRSELAARMQQPASAAYLQQALQVVAALPLHRRQADTGGMFGAPHAGTALLLGRLCNCGGLPASTAAAAAWPFVEAMPHLAAMLAAVAADDSISVNQLAVACYGVQLASYWMVQHLPPISTDSQLAAWAAAVDASVELEPLLLQLQERCRSVPDEALQEAPLRLSRQLLVLLAGAGAASAHVKGKLAAAQPAAADERLTRQLWALHTSMCRLVAWLAADPGGGRAALLANDRMPGMAYLLQGFSRVRQALVGEATRALKEGLLSQERLHGMCAAHWAALQTLVQMLGGLAGCGDVLSSIVSDLYTICRNCEPLLTDGSLLALLSEAFVQLATKLPQLPESSQRQVAKLLDHVAGAIPRAGCLVAEGVHALKALDAAAEELDAPAAPTAQQRLLLQQVQQAAGVSAGVGFENGASSATVLALLPAISDRLPAATRLADLLHQWWQPAMQPERHKAAQLVLAQAAATRSCAYLRCANLGGKGGPAAGEVVGSKRCSACRAVWYCGTACSHADWREGGHRRVCKPLGAARRAAKEAAAAAAALAEEAGEGQRGS